MITVLLRFVVYYRDGDETQAPARPTDDARQHAAMREFGGLALMKSADELTYGAGAVAGRFEPDKRDSGVEAAEYLNGIPADRSNRAAEIAGVSQAQRAHLATLQSFVSFETVVRHGRRIGYIHGSNSFNRQMAKKKQPPGEPMTLGNMRALGVQRLVATCLNDACDTKA